MNGSHVITLINSRLAHGKFEGQEPGVRLGPMSSDKLLGLGALPLFIFKVRFRQTQKV